MFPTSLNRNVAQYVAGIVLALQCVSAKADLPHPQVTGVFPAGGRVGSTFDVSLSGTDLDDADRLLFSHPGIQATAKSSAASEFEQARLTGGFSVQIAADVPPGVYDVRVVSRFGLSNPRSFVVGNRPEIVEAGGNNQKDKPMDLPIGTVANGRADGSSVDYYKLTLKAGQRIFAECWAHRIDSRMDPTLVLYDPTGREVVRNRDANGRDALLDFKAPADGAYTLGLYDFVFSGGAEYFYRLLVHEGPVIDYVFPPAGTPGSKSNFTIFGRGLAGGQPASGLISNGQELEKLAIELTIPNDDAAIRGLAVPANTPISAVWLDSFEHRLTPDIVRPIYFAKSPPVTELEPNSDAAHAQTVTVPCEVAGQFYPNRDEDWIQFEAKKGDRFSIEVISQRMGIYSDPFMLIQRVTRNQKGEESVSNVAQVDDPGDRGGRIGTDFDLSSDDPTYRLEVAEDSTYRIMVRDQFGSNRKVPGTLYRLAIRKLEPDFRLVAITQPIQAPANPNVFSLGAISVRKGGTATIEVRIDRMDGFAGDVEVVVEGLPKGVTCPESILGSAMTSVPLVFVAADDAARWEGTIRVVGRAKLDDKPVTRVARAAYAVWGTGNRAQQAASFRMARELTFAVAGKELDKALVQVVPTGIIETSKGGKIDVPLKVTRRDDFKGDLTLVSIGVPNEIKPANLVVKGDQADAQLPFAATNGNAKPGVYTFVLRADTKVKHIRNPEAQSQAEAEQKAVDAKAKELTEAVQKANQVKEAAAKGIQEIAAAVALADKAKGPAEAEAKQAAEAAKQAADAARQAAEAAKKAAELAAVADKTRLEAEAKNAAAAQKLAVVLKTLQESQAKAKAAEDAKLAAEKTIADNDAKLKATQAAKQAIDKRLDEVKKANAPKDLDTAFLSTPIKVRIVETPIQLTIAAPNAPLVQGQKSELPVSIGRLYGFDGQVEIGIEVPNGVAGLQINRVTIPKDQTQGKFEISAAANATVGEHAVTVRAKSQFNNVSVEALSKIVVKVAAPAK